MMPRALLINPWIEDFTAHDLWARPAGLLQLAAVLRSAGWGVDFIDCLDVHYPGRVLPPPRRKMDGSGKFDQAVIPKPAALSSIVHRRFRRFGLPAPALSAALAAAPRPDLVLVNTVMTYWYTGVQSTVAEIRRAFGDVPVVAGGVYATLLPEHALANIGVDFAAAGDFRSSLPPLLKDLGLPHDLPVADLFPAWDLYPRMEGAAVITGRGCPHRCPYCAVHAVHPALERREPGEVCGEIERLARDFKVRDVAFFDDAIRAGGDGHLTAILEGVIRLGLPVRFHAINALHLRGLSEELAGLIRRAGFATLRFGLETADPERSRSLGAKASPDDLRDAVSALKAAGYAGREIGVYLLAGLPGQPSGEVESGIREVLRAGARPYLSEYSPVPQSPMWEEAVSNSRLDISSEPLFHNNVLLSCAREDFDFRELDRLKKIARES